MPVLTFARTTTRHDAAVIETHHADLDGLPVTWRSAGAERTLYLHGVPDHGELWTPFLERTGGVAPDLPGFGASAKRGDLDYSIDGYADWIGRFCALAELDRVNLVMHDWGAVGLAFAQRAPERIERLVAIDTIPFLPGYRWHPLARVWRTPIAGEVAMGMAIKPVVRRLLPAGRAQPVLAAFDPGTQRAILLLYRSSPPGVLAAAGARLGTIAAPALVLHGARDRYIPSRFADGLAAALGDGIVEHVPGAGHWPWLDRPELVDRVAAFLRA
jgi:pimeloyl-ACP methyl ester carboxylesterase